MDTNVLVTYASKYGATREIAEKIGEVLHQAGLQVHVLASDRVNDLNPYDAVILGSAIYIGKWQKEAVEFLRAYANILADRPVWLFSSGPTGTGDPVDLVEGVRLPAALQPIVDQIHPRDITVFHGNINPDKINGIEKWAVQKVVKKPLGDYRDWDSIVAWAGMIAIALREVEPALYNK